MSSTATHQSARELLLEAARTDNTGQAELRCKTLLGLVDLSRSLEQILKRQLALCEITEQGFMLLAQLIRDEPATLTPSQIAGKLQLPRPAVSTILGRLEVSGLIQRERSRSDLRSLAVIMTEKGRRLFEAANSECLKSICQLMSHIDQQELAQFDSTCTRLTQYFQSYAHEPHV